ncbi:MAG: DUF481 domain-containing protein [Vicinamibacterales bacterium]
MRLLPYLLSMALSVLFGMSTAAQVPNGDAADIRALEATLLEALHARDREGLEHLLAMDYVLRGVPDIDRDTWLRSATTLCWGDRSDVEAFEARPYADVVIASFELTFYVDPVTCQTGVRRSLITDVWVRETDGWKLKVRHAAAPPASNGDLAAQYGIVPEPPPSLEASSEFSAVATGGNTATRTVGLGAQLTHRTDRRTTGVAMRFLTSQADEVTNARLLTVEGRHGFTVTDRLQVFGEALYRRDRFAGIDHRIVATAGVAHTLSVPDPQSLIVRGGLGWTVEQRLAGATLRFATATGTLDYGWKIAAGTELREEAIFNADLEAAENWRAASTTALSVTLTRLLSLRASHAIEYRRTPVIGFGRSDMRTAVTLVLSMTRRPGAP